MQAVFGPAGANGRWDTQNPHQMANAYNAYGIAPASCPNGWGGPQASATSVDAPPTGDTATMSARSADGGTGEPTDDPWAPVVDFFEQLVPWITEATSQ